MTAVVCAWGGEVISPEDGKGGRTSHGICPACRAKYFPELGESTTVLPASSSEPVTLAGIEAIWRTFGARSAFQDEYLNNPPAAPELRPEWVSPRILELLIPRRAL